MQINLGLTVIVMIFASSCKKEDDPNEEVERLRNSFTCAAPHTTHTYETDKSSLLIGLKLSGQAGTTIFQVYGDGSATTSGNRGGEAIPPKTKSVTKKEIQSLLQSVVDDACLLSITEEAVVKKVALVDAAYKKAYPGESYNKGATADCGSTSIEVNVDGKQYKAAFDGCNSFLVLSKSPVDANGDGPAISEKVYFYKAYSSIAELMSSTNLMKR